MDVNAIGNNVNSINVYSTSSDVSHSTSTGVGDNSQVSNRQVKKNQETQTRQDGNSGDTKELDKAIKKLNKFLEDDKTHAEYSVQKDFGTIMVKIINDETKEVVLEIPSEKYLDMIAAMCRQAGLLDKKA